MLTKQRQTSTIWAYLYTTLGSKFKSYHLADFLGVRQLPTLAGTQAGINYTFTVLTNTVNSTQTNSGQRSLWKYNNTSHYLRLSSPLDLSSRQESADGRYCAAQYQTENESDSFLSMISLPQDAHLPFSRLSLMNEYIMHYYIASITPVNRSTLLLNL